MSYYDSRKNQFISVPSTSSKYFTNNDAIETFYDGTTDGDNIVRYQDEENGEFIVNNQDDIINSLKNKYIGESFTNPKVKGNRKARGRFNNKDNTNKIETFDNSGPTNNDPLETVSDEGALGKILNVPVPGVNSGNYNAVINGKRTTVYVPRSELSKEEDPGGDYSWSAGTTRVPDDLNYNISQGNLSKAVLPLPPECNGMGLNPDKAEVIRSSNTGAKYFYQAGRKMKIPDQTAPNDCKILKEWLNSDTIKLSDVSNDCVNAIPTVNGIGSDGKIDCDADLKPSQRVDLANKYLEESNKYSTRGRKAALLYNTKTAIAASKYGEIEKVNNLMTSQVDNSNSNSSKLEKLDNSIYSQQRQVQISNDEARRKNENLFLLKILLTYLLIISIPLILKRSFRDNFKTPHVILVIIFISLPFIYIIGWNLYSIRNRSPMRWPLRNWPVGQIPGGETDTNETITPTCQPLEPEPNCEEEARYLEQKINEIDRQKRARWEDANRLLKKEKELGSEYCDLPEQCTGSYCKAGYNVNFTT